MPDKHLPTRHRCHKCFHRLEGHEEHCAFCGEPVDLGAAAHAAERYNRKRNLYYNSLKRKAAIQQIVLTVLLMVCVVLMLMLLDYFRG